jgi:hypothetical protein
MQRMTSGAKLGQSCCPLDTILSQSKTGCPFALTRRSDRRGRP